MFIILIIFQYNNPVKILYLTKSQREAILFLPDN